MAVNNLKSQLKGTTMSSALQGRAKRRPSSFLRKLLWLVLTTRPGIKLVRYAWDKVDRRYWQKHREWALPFEPELLRFEMPQLYGEKEEQYRLCDGFQVRSGIKVVEVHVNSEKSAALHRSGTGPKGLIPCARRDLERLVLVVQKGLVENFDVLAIRHSPHSQYMRGIRFELFACEESIGIKFERFYTEGILLLYRDDHQHSLLGPFYDGFLSKQRLLRLIACGWKEKELAPAQ